MPSCCDPASYGRIFSAKEADRRLRDYRRGGPDRRAGDILDFAKSRGVRGKSVLEVGGGIGDLQVEFLKAGAANCVNVELSPEYEDAARRLLEDEGLDGRVERKQGDFVTLAGDLAPADIVVLNRVICCYPHMAAMVGEATLHTGELLALVVPRDGFIGRLFVGVANPSNRIRGCGFRAFLHPVEAIEARVVAGGLRRVHSSRDMIWQGMVFERTID
ncbi:MAG: class I SAM-dependent methyltransferase [Acidimicrobiia bacterium]